MGLKPSAMPTTGSGWFCATLDARPSLSTREGCRLKASRRLHPTRRAPPAEVSRARGRRALAVRRLPSGPPRVRDARGAGSLRSCETQDPRRELRPNPIRSDTSCRAIAAHQLESLMLCGRRASYDELARYASDDPAARARLSRVNAGASGSRGPGTHRFRSAQTEGQGPLHPDLREEGPRSAAPEVPFIDEPPGRGTPGFRPVSPVR